jgi:GT2 family glycosyltransferase
MNTKDTVSIIIPNFNGEDLLRKNIPLVMKAVKNPENKIIEVIVVDDASRDGSAELIKKEFSEIKLVKHKVNRGFSASVNTGARLARGAYLCLINSDVHPNSDFLRGPLKLFSEDKNLFGISFHEKGRGWAGGKFEDGFMVHFPGKENDEPHKTLFVNAGGALYKREFWMKLGGMDEAVFSPFYWEDVDISYRALKRGYGLLWDPSATVSENVSATMKKLSPKRIRLIQERNQLLFIWKNIASSRLIRRHIAGLMVRILRHPGYLRVLFAAITKLGPVLKSRRREIKESKISDETIFSRFSE